jgi:hypothetical protein
MLDTFRALRPYKQKPTLDDLGGTEIPEIMPTKLCPH